VRQRARELGRLLMHIRKSDEVFKDEDLKSCLVPVRFDMVLESVRDLATQGDGHILALPLKLGHSIRKLFSILDGKSIRIGDSVQSDICSRFNRLLNSDWTDRVSSKALRDLYNNKLNKNEEVPLTDHVVKLKEYLDDEVEEDFHAFNKKPGRENGRKLAENLLTQIMVFNKRRGGEAARLKVDTYLDVKKKCEDLKLNHELFCSLDEDEKLMANSHLLIRRPSVNVAPMFR
jgi:hypothetical protein